MKKRLLALTVGFAAVFVAFYLIFYGATLAPSLVIRALITGFLWSVGMHFFYKLWPWL